MTLSFNDLYKQKELLSQIDLKPTESVERLKISRGYYANFLFAGHIAHKFKIPKRKFSKNNPDIVLGSHQRIHETLIQSGNPNLQHIGRCLGLYHELRKFSDYDIKLNLEPSDIKEAEYYFEQCRHRLEFYYKNPNLPYKPKAKIIEYKQILMC